MLRAVLPTRLLIRDNTQRDATCQKVAVCIKRRVREGQRHSAGFHIDDAAPVDAPVLKVPAVGISGPAWGVWVDGECVDVAVEYNSGTGSVTMAWAGGAVEFRDNIWL